MLDPLPRRQRPEAGTQVAAPQAAAAPSVLPDLAADAGRLPTVEAIEEEALRVAVEEAQRLNAADGAACAEATQAAKEATGKRQQEDGERRRRSKVVQNIALREKLGIPYRTTGAACVPRRQKRLKKPCARVVPAAPAAAPASAPDSLQAMAEENARLLSRVGWRRLAKKRRGRSALSDEVGSLPHEAAGYLDYLRQLGVPVHSSAPPKSPVQPHEAEKDGRPRRWAAASPYRLTPHAARGAARGSPLLGRSSKAKDKGFAAIRLS